MRILRPQVYGYHSVSSLFVILRTPNRCYMGRTTVISCDIHLDLLGNFGKPKAMTEDDIHNVIQRFTRSAALVKKAGFTGLQIHCAHGYLFSQFLSPKINRRTDQWGGSLENRARIIRLTIKSVRNEVGADFPIAVKLSK